MEIREAVENDLEGLLLLYTQLHENPMPATDASLHRLWSSICADENYHILVADENCSIVSSCIVVVVPNLTHGQRPYARNSGSGRFGHRTWFLFSGGRAGLLQLGLPGQCRNRPGRLVA